MNGLKLWNSIVVEFETQTESLRNLNVVDWYQWVPCTTTIDYLVL